MSSTKISEALLFSDELSEASLLLEESHKKVRDGQLSNLELALAILIPTAVLDSQTHC